MVRGGCCHGAAMIGIWLLSILGGVSLQGPAHELVKRPSRVLIAGTSGSGKTSLAATIASAAALPHTEIDALFHGPRWVPRPSFESDVHRFAAQAAWVTEWQYGAVRWHLADRADLMVWLDLPKRIVIRQVVVRTLRRRLCRQRLWNGNLEPPLWTILRDPDHIIRWAWATHEKSSARIAQLLERRPDLPVVRLTSHEEARAWVAGPLAQVLRRTSR